MVWSAVCRNAVIMSHHANSIALFNLVPGVEAEPSLFIVSVFAFKPNRNVVWTGPEVVGLPWGVFIPQPPFFCRRGWSWPHFSFKHFLVIPKRIAVKPLNVTLYSCIFNWEFCLVQTYLKCHPCAWLVCTLFCRKWCGGDSELSEQVERLSNTF